MRPVKGNWLCAPQVRRHFQNSKLWWSFSVLLSSSLAFQLQTINPFQHMDHEKTWLWSKYLIPWYIYHFVSNKTQQWPQDWKRSVCIPIPNKGNAKDCWNYHTIALISHASKVMLKILQARLQQHVNCELPDVHAGFRKGRGTRDQVANICWIIKKRKEFQKNIYLCFIDYAKPFDCVDDNKLWKILKEMGIPDHLTCLLRNLYPGQEARVRKRSTSRLYIVTLLI